MKGDPILRGPKEYMSPLGRREKIVAYGGLNYLRGNSSPYFSLTGDVWELRNGRWQDDMGGCIHEELMKHWPELAPLAALHLSYIDGAPSAAAENGFYFACGGSFMGSMWLHASTNYQSISPDDYFRGCLKRHLRISEEDAAELIRVWRPRAISPAGYQQGKKDFAVVTDAMRPRWKAEADAAIKEFGLIVYGDHWKGEAA